MALKLISPVGFCRHSVICDRLSYCTPSRRIPYYSTNREGQTWHVPVERTNEPRWPSQHGILNTPDVPFHATAETRDVLRVRQGAPITAVHGCSSCPPIRAKGSADHRLQAFPDRVGRTLKLTIEKKTQLGAVSRRSRRTENTGPRN